MSGVKLGCELCRTSQFPGGRPFCARCEPERFKREVEALKQEISKTAALTWTDGSGRRVVYEVRLRGTRRCA